MAEVPRTATPLVMREVARVGARAFGALSQRMPPLGMLAIQCAIIGVENADGAAIIQHNWGNLMGEGPAGYWVPASIKAGQPTKFRAYVDQDEGAAAWWRLMFRKFMPVLLAGTDNDPAGAIGHLYRLGYVVASRPGEQADYTTAAVKLFARARSEWIPQARIYPRGPAYAGVLSALGAVGAKLGGF